jgi:hypothetical protein
MTKNPENPSNCASQKPKAKSKIVGHIVRLVRAFALPCVNEAEATAATGWVVFLYLRRQNRSDNVGK